MFSWEISGFVTYFMVFGKLTKNALPKAFIYIQANTMRVGVGCVGGWGGDNHYGISLWELIFPTFTRRVVFFILRNLIS